jgi:hypothetical protein
MHPDQILIPFLPYFAAGIAIEATWYLIVRRHPYPWKETFASLSVFLLRVPVHLISSLAVGGVLFLAWSLRPVTVPLDTAWGIVLLFLALEQGQAAPDPRYFEKK